MDITKLKSNLQSAIPEEVYQIEPNKVFLFIPREGIAVLDMLKESDSLLMIFPDIEIKLNFFPTDNEALIGGYAIKIPQETGTPDKVVIGSKDSLPGFARVAFGEDAAEDEGTPSPIIISLDPKDRQKKGICSTCPFKKEDGDFSEEVLLVKPEKGSAEERHQIAKEEKKLEKILRECAILGIELDIDRIKKKVAEDLKKAIDNNIDYKLNIKKQRNKLRPRTIEYNTYDIYVADGEEYKLELTGIQKAIYITFLLYPQGIRIQDTFGEFREITKKIYGSLPSSEKNEKESGGIRDAKGTTYESHLNSLRSDLTHIREAVADKIADPLIAQDFAIEGLSGAPYSIARNTPEIVAQIKEDFGL